MIYVITTSEDVDSCCCGNSSIEVENILVFLVEHKKEDLDINKLLTEFHLSDSRYQNLYDKAMSTKTNLTRDKYLKRSVASKIKKEALTFKEFLIKKKGFKDINYITYNAYNEYVLD